MLEVDVEIAIVVTLLVLAIVGFFCSWCIPKRKDFEQDWYGPTRGFAKLKAAFEHVGMSKPGAALMTECVSGVLHAPLGFVTGFLLSQQIAHARWAAALVYVFWMGFGIGRAHMIEKGTRHRPKL